MDELKTQKNNEGDIFSKPLSKRLDGICANLFDGSRQYMGIETGLGFIDDTFSGLYGMVLIGGVGGVGKTSLVLQMALGACKKGTPVIFYSIEMSEVEIMVKMLNGETGIPLDKIFLNGKRYLDPEYKEEANTNYFSSLSTEDVEKLKEAKVTIKGYSGNFHLRTIEDKENPIFAEKLLEEVERVKAIHKVDEVLVVVDHLQILGVENGKSNQIEKDDFLIGECKKVQGITNSTFLIISQLNKNSFEKKPGLDAFKGSVQLSYSPTLAIVLENEKNIVDGEEKEARIEQDNIPMQLNVLKSRFSSKNNVRIKFNAETGVFTGAKDQKKNTKVSGRVDPCGASVVEQDQLV